MRDDYGDQRPYVDTGPLLEKPIAEAAGVGWQGKSTILVGKRGTWSFLANIVTTLELPTDKQEKDRWVLYSLYRRMPYTSDHCAYQLDASKCISYLTIGDGAISQYREAIGDRLYGCDECPMFALGINGRYRPRRLSLDPVSCQRWLKCWHGMRRVLLSTQGSPASS